MNPLSLLTLIVLLLLTAGFSPAHVSAGTLQPLTGEQHELAPGVTYSIVPGKYNLAGEELSVYLLEVDITQPDLEILPVTAGDRFGDLETVEALARRHNALAAVNGGYFYRSGGLSLPLGNLIIEGKPLSLSDFWRSSFSLSREDRTLTAPTAPLQLVFGHFQPRAELVLPGSRVMANSINSRSTLSGIHMHTPEWAEEQVGTPGSFNAAYTWAGLNTYRLFRTSSEPLPVPAAGLVLRFNGEAAHALATALPSQSLLVVEHQYDRSYWGDIEHLMTAGPMLMRGGNPVFVANQEGFTGTVLQPNSRTALGINDKGWAMLVVAERKLRGSRVGLTLEEMALLMSELGAVEAICLDGGGSSTFFAAGMVMGHAALTPRPVANALLVMQGPRLYLNNHRIYPDMPPVIDEGRTLVPVRVIMESLQAAVEWEGESRTVTISGYDMQIALTIDSREAYINGAAINLEIPPRIIGGRTMLPVRFVTETLQGKVHWDPVKRSIYLNM